MQGMGSNPPGVIGVGMGTRKRVFSSKPIGLAFSAPLTIFTRHVPHCPKPLQLTHFIEARPKTVQTLVQIDTGLERFLPQIGTDGNLDLNFFFDEFDDRHEYHPQSRKG